MGLSIHYKGRLKETASLPEILEELKEIAGVFGWRITGFNKNFDWTIPGLSNEPLHVSGVYITPPECETIMLLFDQAGRLCNPAWLSFYDKSRDPQELEWVHQLSVKTQFAGVEVHKKVIHLFKYLHKNYFAELDFMDEGNYWETLDENILQTQFSRYNELLDNFSLALESTKQNPGENIEDFIKRVVQRLRDKKQ